MLIRVLSDIHLEIEPFDPPAAKADVVVLAGDIANGTAGIEWARRQFDGPVLYVPGNHEYYDGEYHAVHHALETAARRNDVALLDGGAITISGARFLGCTLWTDFTLVPETERARVIELARSKNPDYAAIRYRDRLFSPEDGITLCRAQRAWLQDALAAPCAGPTVVITHFAPHPDSIAPTYAGHPANPGFVVPLHSLMGRAALWIHGHTHTAFDYMVAGTRLICNPRGYPGEDTGWAPGLVVPVETPAS